MADSGIPARLAMADAPLHGSGSISLPIGTSLAGAERAIIEATLSHLGGNKQRTARTLGCSLKTLYNKLNGYSQMNDWPPDDVADIVGQR